jgi:hypothetical protein
LYGWNGERPAKPVSGQKALVLRGLAQHRGEVKSGHEWATIIGPGLATRQDPYRVVLYYILLLKKDGCVRTVEQDIEAVTVNEDVKHAIVVRTDSNDIEVRNVFETTVPENEEEDEDEEEESDYEDDDEDDEAEAEAE